MTCNSCSSSSSSSFCGCKKIKAMDVDTPLNAMANGDVNFCFTEITDAICASLGKDEGIHPQLNNKNTTCEDLSSLNDLATGSLHNALMTLDMCDVDAYKCWLDNLLSWQWNVDKGIICAICGIWQKLRCIDSKSRTSIQAITLWEGDRNIFDLPSITVSKDLSDFDFLDLHIVNGTERVVVRISLEDGLSGTPTAVHVDKTSGNSSYSMAPGAIAAKEIGLRFPNHTTVLFDHFIWSITGTSVATLNSIQTGSFIAFSDTTHTKAYNDSQDVASDKPHKVMKIEGIISRDTGSCF